MYHVSKVKAFVFIACMCAVMSNVFVSNASPTTGGTTGKINTNGSAVIGSTLSVQFYTLEVSRDYSVVVNDVVFTNITTSSSQTQFTLYIPVAEDGTTNTMKIVLNDANITAIDTAYVIVTDSSTFTMQDLFISVFVSLLILSFIAAIVGGIGYVGVKKVKGRR